MPNPSKTSDFDAYFDADSMPPLMTIPQAALALNAMPLSTVRALCARGEIVSIKIGRQWRVNRDALYRQFGIPSKFSKKRSEAPARVYQTPAEAS